MFRKNILSKYVIFLTLIQSVWSQDFNIARIHYPGGGDWGTNYPSSGSVSEDTDYYITYIRTSTGFTVQIRSGSHTGTLLYDSDKTSSKTPTGLQYIWLGWSNRGQSTGADWVGTIDDFEIYDGVTSLDATWKERGSA